MRTTGMCSGVWSPLVNVSFASQLAFNFRSTYKDCGRAIKLRIFAKNRILMSFPNKDILKRNSGKVYN